MKSLIENLKHKWKAQPIAFICLIAISVMVVATIFICCINVYNRDKKIIEYIDEANKAKQDEANKAKQEAQQKALRKKKNQLFLTLLEGLCIIHQEGWKELDDLESAIYYYNHLIDEGYEEIIFLKGIKIKSPYVQKDIKSGKLRLRSFLD